MTKEEFLKDFVPLMVSYYKGGACKLCGAWVPALSNFTEDERKNYELHLKWHKDNEAKHVATQEVPGAVA